MKNYNIAVKKRGGDMIFLRKIVPGAADDSYGVEVAKLAGLPNTVITRAREILRELENGDSLHTPATPRPAETEFEDQMSMLDMTAQNIRLALEELNVETMTPIEAMNELYKLKLMLK